MSRWIAATLLVLAVVPAWAGEGQLASASDRHVVVHGIADGKVTGWRLVSMRPDGWTADCCRYARAIGVNEVIYKGDWTGEPLRVMVLNVWPSKLASLDNEWQADQQRYRQKDPAARITVFPVQHATWRCRGFIYQGNDHVDDAVVFCDPGKHAGVRLSWSMAVAANDPGRAQVLAQFRQVVEASRYSSEAVPTRAPHAVPHA